MEMSEQEEELTLTRSTESSSTVTVGRSVCVNSWRSVGIGSI